MSFYQFSIALNKTITKDNELYDKTIFILKNNLFNVNPYYSYKIYDVSNLTNPVDNMIHSNNYFYIDWRYDKTIDLFFSELNYTLDINPLYIDRSTKSYLKYHHDSSVNKPVNDNKDDLISFYIRPELKLDEVIVAPRKIPLYLSEAVTIVTILLRSLQLILEHFNHFEGKQKIISKLSKIDENIKILHEKD